MQFGILIFINIILWALFYLVISLKLERSASEFREKRLRREIDGIIREFNETAERNISILENRIATMKKLLAHSGTLKRIDVNIGDDAAGENDLRGGEDDAVFPGKLFNSASTNDRIKSAYGVKSPAGNDFTHRSLKEQFRLLLRETGNKLANYLQRGEARNVKPPEKPNPAFPGGGAKGSEKITLRNNPVPAVEKADGGLIERKFSDLHAMAIDEVEKTGDPNLSETELSGMFENTGDKYSLIAELHRRGYDVGLLSRCSGISHGEITLVLNLNKSQ